MGVGILAKFVGEMDPGDVFLVPLAAVRHERARQISESGPCWECKKGPVGTGPVGSVFGEMHFIEKRGEHDEWDRFDVKRVFPGYRPPLGQRGQQYNLH